MEVHGATFAIMGAELINLYSLENPILSREDECYFLFFNLVDYHRPLIGKGIILQDKSIDGLHKKYYIELKEICEGPNVIEEFVINKNFNLFAGDEMSKGESVFSRFKKLINVNSLSVFKGKTLYVEAFFVRKTHEELLKFRSEYIQAVRKDIEKQLKDIESI